jgi:hypothetical protein
LEKEVDNLSIFSDKVNFNDEFVCEEISTSSRPQVSESYLPFSINHSNQSFITSFSSPSFFSGNKMINNGHSLEFESGTFKNETNTDVKFLIERLCKNPECIRYHNWFSKNQFCCDYCRTRYSNVRRSNPFTYWRKELIEKRRALEEYGKRGMSLEAFEFFREELLDLRKNVGVEKFKDDSLKKKGKKKRKKI